MDTQQPDTLLIELTASIVGAYVGHNALSRDDLPKLIADVHATLRTLGTEPAPEPVMDLKPAVPINKSVRPDHIVCLEDGLRFKSLKRHLRTEHQLTPDEYRKKWGLPPTYPMVAASYSERRSQLAKDLGLGRKAEE